MAGQKKGHRRNKMAKKWGILCIGILWTGLMIMGLFEYYGSIHKLEEKIGGFLSETALGKITAYDYYAKGNQQTYGMKGTLAYVVENKHTIAEVEEENLVRLVSVFPGKNIENCFWSSAATKKEKEVSLFRKESGKEDMKLFQNGSSDITVWNASDKEKNTENQQEYAESTSKKITANRKMIEKLEKTHSRSYLLKNFYIVDSSTSIDNKIFQVKSLLEMNLTLKKKKEPQILIFHTHGASEAFADSRKGKEEDSIIGVGAKLAKELSDTYGYEVLHDKTPYDMVDGKIDRNQAYNQAYESLCKTLKKYPDIQVIIDLHRDGVGMKVDRTTIVDGKKTAQAMFFNGLSRNSSGDIAYLKNDNLQANLAFSLQLKLASMKRYEDFARPVYLKGYRYNLHLRKRFTLIELGNENNTVSEAQNAAKPLAKIINDVLEQ